MNIKSIIYSVFLLHYFYFFCAMNPVDLAFKQCKNPKFFNETSFSELLRNGVDINTRDFLGISLLYSAVVAENYLCAKFLLANGADVNLMDINRRATPLHMACFKESEKIVRLLLAQEAIDPNIKSTQEDQATPLILSSKKPERKSKDIVKILLGNKSVVSGIDECDINSDTALIASVSFGNLEVVKMLLERRANIEKQGQLGATALGVACFEGHTRIVTFLIENKANSKARDMCDRTPLHYAAQKGRLEIMKILINAGADINAYSNNNITPMHFAIDFYQLEQVKLLGCSTNIDMSLKDNMDRTYLYCAMLQNNIPMIQFFISKFSKELIAYVNQQSKFTVFEAACSLGAFDCVRALLDARVTNPDKFTSKEHFLEDTAPEKIATDYGYNDIADYIRDFKRGKIVSCQYEFTTPIKQVEYPSERSKKKNVRSNQIVNNTAISARTKNDNSQKTGSYLGSDQLINLQRCTDQKINNDADNVNFFVIHDYQRGDKGGYRNEIFLFAHDKPGCFYEVEDKHKKVTRLEQIKQLDNVGSQLPTNPLENLELSKDVQEKMKNLRDNFHAFCSNVECNGGLGRVKVCDLKTTPARKEYLKKQFNISESLDTYWFELTVDIPGQIRFIGYPQDLAQHQGPLGNFNYIVLKKSLADTDGLCVHRFFTKA